MTSIFNNIRSVALSAAFALSIIALPTYAQQSSNDMKVASIERNKQDNTPSSVMFAPSSGLQRKDADQIFNTYLGVDGVNVKMKLQNSSSTRTGLTIDRYNQYYKGIKVARGSYVLTSKKDAAQFMNGNYYNMAEDLSATPALKEDKALANALAKVNAQEYMWQIDGMEKGLKERTKDANATYYPKGELVWIEDVLGKGTDSRKLRLAYAFNIYAMKPFTRQMVYVDANTGNILYTNQLLHAAGGIDAAASGASKYSGTVNFRSFLSGGTYYLNDNTRGGGINTYNMAGGSSTGNPVTSATSTFTSDIALDAHWGAEKVYDYWNSVHGRNSVDGDGMALNNFVHFSSGYNNAFWDGSEMIYGDGTGSAGGGFDPLASLDVCAHEIGHGICQFTAGLEYEKESGGMNEGFSDIWGAVIENYADPHETDAKAKNMWAIGEEIATTPLRRMDNPNLRGQPDTYGGSGWVSVTSCSPVEGNDYCGVHTNSGVLNYWFYLLCVGGSGTNDLHNAFSVSPLTVAKGADIVYATELMLTSTATYADCRIASIRAATAMYGTCSPEVESVTRAWYAVGVGADFAPGTAGTLSGGGAICVGSSATLSSTVTGGSWFSNNTDVATVGMFSGEVRGVSAGTATITYVQGVGCYPTTVITVNAAGAEVSITGASMVDVASNITLTPSVPGGTWSAGNSNATVGSTGIVTGVAAGTVTISYTVDNGCGPVYATKDITVNATVDNTITGSRTLCVSGTSLLGDAISGGTWSSSTPSVATIGLSTGLVTGIAVGTARITYTYSGGSATAIVTVSSSIPAITGGTTVCPGATLTLSNTATGGTWTSSNTAVATIDGTTGVVTGIAAGSCNITYAVGGCTKLLSLTVKSLPNVITGTTALCLGGATSTLTNSTSGGGTWSSGSTWIATIGATSGVMTAVAAGTATITYTAGLTGCKRTTDVTVNAPLGPIVGDDNVCIGSSITLSPTEGTGTWTSSVTTRATVGSSSGIVTGLAAGTTIITFTQGACKVTKIITVNSLPAAITGTTSTCAGTIVTLNNTTTGGTWSTTPGTGAVTIDPASGAMTGTLAGTATVIYTSAANCARAITVNVNAAVPTIGGTTTICPGTTTTLTNAVTGGTWSSSTTAVATVVSGSGLVSGISAGTTGITYTLSAGCKATTIVSVSAGPAAITGTLSVCPAATTALSNAVSGGIWSSSTPAVGTIDAASGVATGIATGTTVITYTIGSCTKIALMTVKALPAVISGSTSVCPGSTTTLSSATSGGGTWASGLTTVATIGSSNGIVSGVATGSATITYTAAATGCKRTADVTVNTAPAVISGTLSACIGATTALSSSGSGTWSSSNTAVATVGSTGIVTGVTAGSATITYSFGGACRVTAAVAITALPGTITGPASICNGSTASYTDPTTGGTWSSIDGSGTATMGSTGILTATSAGTVTVVYTSGAGCARSLNVTISSALPAIGGGLTICAGSTTTLTNATTGGTWASGATGIATVVSGSGVVTGVAEGSATITYTVGAGCKAMATVTVSAAPTAITGTLSSCPDGSTYTLGNSVSGGAWSSSAPAVAAIDGTTGIVTALTTGTTTITYAIGSCQKTATFTVKAIPAAITGATNICTGSTITLSSATSGGGTWVSSDVTKATIGSSNGIVTGVSAGTTTITFTSTATGCKRTADITIDVAPDPITGTRSACIGTTTQLTSSGSGTWSSSNIMVATVGTDGVVTGISAGPATITYLLGGNCRATAQVTINPLPASITGATSICVSSVTTLSNATTGGTWSSVNGSGTISAGSSSGIVTGLTPGTGTVIYTISATGCTRSVTVTVNAAVADITGVNVLCKETTITLADATTGGTWTSGNTAVATVVAGLGVVTGVNAGTATITYTISGGCRATMVVTVLDAPGYITGTTSVCEASTTTLTSTGGGTWSSSDPVIGSIDASGVVSGIQGGATTITNSFANGCFKSVTVTVKPLPAPITGIMEICATGSTTLISATAGGGSWISSNGAVGSIGYTSGVFIPVGAGTTTISYTAINTSCTRTRVLTVDATPAPITGETTICSGSSVTLSTTSTGGVWSTVSGSGSVNIDGSGLTTGVTPGTATVYYTITGTGCVSSIVVTVTPPIAVISGPSTICTGNSTTYTNAATGGTWVSSNTAAGTINTSTGQFDAIASGITTLTYRISSACATSITVTVNATPSAITGNVPVCRLSSITLSSTPTGGAWSSVTPAIGTINAATGSFTALTAGTTTVNYIVNGCAVSTVVTVNALPLAITGNVPACTGRTITLSNATVGGGTWISSNTAVATIGSATGIVSGVLAGTSTITFTATNTGCVTTAVATVNTTPAPIAGVAAICQNAVLSLNSSPSGGAWSSSDPAVGTVDASGNVTGISAGTTTITYTLSGCSQIALVTVMPLPATITGNSGPVCTGNNLNLASATAGGGTWLSGNTTAATVNASGVVTGQAAGTSTITFTSTNTGCIATTIVTVNTTPDPISGTTSFCQSTTVTLNTTPAGGAWSSDNSAIGSVDASGVVTGVGAGTTTISYTLNGCSSATIVTVRATPSAITNNSLVCTGTTITLNNATAGGGTWASNTPAVATVGSSSGIVTGVLAGTSTITFTSTNTGCTTTTLVSVNTMPSAFSGTAVCQNATVTLTSTPTGGVWSSTAPAIGSVDVAGVVTGLTAGTTTISYDLSGCVRSAVVTVNATPLAITNNSLVCTGTTITLGNATVGGGTWLSSNTTVATIGSSSGTVSGLLAGTSTITFTATNTGCTITAVVTVNTMPSALSSTFVCQNGMVTLSSTPTGGAWSSTTPAVGTVDAGGTVTGLSAGTTTISYDLSGCVRSAVVTVRALPSAITNNSLICTGTTITLGNATAGGGTWASSNTTVATIGTSGIVSGLLAGTSTITFTSNTTTCITTTVVTVNTMPSALSSTFVCQNSTVTLSSTPTGGAWSSTTPAVGTVDASGVVTGLTAGTTTISYDLSGCVRSAVVTVRALPSAITNNSLICTGTTITLNNATAGGGTWASSNTTVATIGTSGIVSGLLAGTSTITFTSNTTTCTTTTVVTVNTMPSSLSATFVCQNSTTTLSSTPAGGAWISSTPAVGTVDAGGTVTGLTAGTTTISYNLDGCIRSAVVTVRALPSAITGNAVVCEGSTLSLANATAGGGTWASSNTTAATVGTSGTVSGVLAGTSTITFTSNTTTCITTVVVTVSAVPGITGTLSACIGGSSTLTPGAAGGTWSSSNATVGTIGSTTGTVAAIGAGTTTISYTLSASCKAGAVFTVNALPAAITGTLNVCSGSTTVLSTASGAGVWSNSAGTGSVSLVDAGTTATVTGVTTGTAGVTYTLNSTGCERTAIVTVNNAVANITGTFNVCVGSTTDLDDATAGGTWSSSNTTIGTVGSTTGLVAGKVAGTTTITYATSGVCRATAVVTVSTAPGAITGPMSPGALYVCLGNTVALTSTGGGTWSSSVPARGTIDQTTGVLAGIAATGSTTITNTLGGCSVTASVEVRSLPPNITVLTGSNPVCVAGSLRFQATGGTGTWTSGNVTVAAIGGGSGTVTANAGGTAVITYTSSVAPSNLCFRTIVATVNATTVTISGGNTVIMGNTLQLTASAGSEGGAWSSTAPAVGTVTTPGGLVTGISAGTTTISYSVTNACGTHSAANLVTVTTSRPAGPGSSVVENTDNTLQIFPNPTTGAFNIQCGAAGSVTIYTLEGKLVDRAFVTQGVTALQFAKDLAAGVYMCKYDGEDGTSTVVRLIYKHE